VKSPTRNKTRVVEMEEKEKIIHELQHPIPGKKTDPQIQAAYASIHPYTWLQMANFDAPTDEFQGNERPEMNDVETNPGPMKFYITIMILLLANATKGQQIPFGSTYSPTQRGLPSQVCMLQRTPNNTLLIKYQTGPVNFWMNLPYALLYLNQDLNITKPKNSDIQCV